MPTSTNALLKPRPTKSRLTKICFLPMLKYRSAQIVLCEHKHLTLEAAQQCLANRKQEFNALLANPKSPKVAVRHYSNLAFFIREVHIRKAYCHWQQIDHSENAPSSPTSLADNSDDSHDGLSDWLFTYPHATTLPITEIYHLIQASEYHNLPHSLPKAFLPKKRIKGVR